MRFALATETTWIAIAGLALAPAAALAADSSSPGSKLDSTLDKTKDTMGDSWLTTKVKAALLADSAVSGTAVHVETSQGVVTLTGTVESDAARDSAEKIASGIDGVQSVQNELRVAAGSSSALGADGSGAAGTRPMSGPPPVTVRAAQEALKAEGHDPGPIDGILGPRTQGALRAYQEAKGLPVTGRPDGITLAQLGVQDHGRRQGP